LAFGAEEASRRGDTPQHQLIGHFAAGAFATLLATPCSAPFLGTAIGFALARGPLEILSIFLTLGLGMALPYLAIAAFPSLAHHLPKPGAWMLWLRRLLAVVLLGTAGWLLSVLALQSGLSASLAVAGLMTLALLVLALRHLLPSLARMMVVSSLAVAALATTLADLPGASQAAPGSLPAAAKGLWRPFDQAAIGRAVAEGHVVFVDVTAEWCITCQVNKATVVYADPVAKRLKSPDVVAMKADWTNPDDTITAYLASFGRYGIPFNAVYGPGAPDGIALPELLTTEVVLDALDKAARPPGS
jgi:suppressor for copper-sensitivity B